MIGKTLVLANLDVQKENLVTMLAGTEKQIALSDEQLIEIDKQLLVCNLKELKDKFPNLCNSIDLGSEKENQNGNTNFEQLKNIENEYEIWYPKENSTENTSNKYPKENRKLAEIYLGIKTFFEHSKNSKSGLLLLNMSLSELLQVKNKEKLELYLNTVNQKADTSQAISFAILPEVEMQQEKNFVRKRFLGSEESEGKGVKNNEVMEITSLLSKHKVLLCYQFETGEWSSPEYFAKKGQTPYKKENAIYENKEYAKYMCCCYPNLSSEIKNLYLGAAFVVAGMFSCCQKEGEKTRLPKELYPYSAITREELKREKYGCCLSSETKERGWVANPHMTLFSSRTLAFRQGEYQKAEDIIKEGENNVYS